LAAPRADSPFILDSANFPCRDSKFESCPLQWRVCELWLGRETASAGRDRESKEFAAVAFNSFEFAMQVRQPTSQNTEILWAFKLARDAVVEHGIRCIESTG
jgi:hypothetical protein